MPVENILVICLTVVMFSAFAGALAWANRQSARVRAVNSAFMNQPAE